MLYMSDARQSFLVGIKNFLSLEAIINLERLCEAIQPQQFIFLSCCSKKYYQDK